MLLIKCLESIEHFAGTADTATAAQADRDGKHMLSAKYSDKE